MIDAIDVDRYLRFDRHDWAELRAQTPLTLHERDLEALRGINDRIDLEEVVAVYLPLTRLLNLYVSATQNLHRVSATFLVPLRQRCLTSSVLRAVWQWERALLPVFCRPFLHVGQSTHALN